MTGRFDRQIALFGREGQEKIRAASVAVVGAGGLGSHVVQQLALLGVRDFAVIDSEELSDTNRNRYVTARFDDPVPGTLKTDIAERLIKAFDPEAAVPRNRCCRSTVGRWRRLYRQRVTDSVHRPVSKNRAVPYRAAQARGTCSRGS